MDNPFLNNYPAFSQPLKNSQNLFNNNKKEENNSFSNQGQLFGFISPISFKTPNPFINNENPPKSSNENNINNAFNFLSNSTQNNNNNIFNSNLNNNNDINASNPFNRNLQENPLNSFQGKIKESNTNPFLDIPKNNINSSNIFNAQSNNKEISNFSGFTNINNQNKNNNISNSSQNNKQSFITSFMTNSNNDNLKKEDNLFNNNNLNLNPFLSNNININSNEKLNIFTQDKIRNDSDVADMNFSEKENKVEKINEQKNNTYEFRRSPQKPLEIIKEEEELKLKKESSSKEIFFEEKNNKINLENDSDKNSIKDTNINNENIKNLNIINEDQKEEENENEISINEQKIIKDKIDIKEDSDENTNNIGRDLNNNNLIDINDLLNNLNDEEELNKIVQEDSDNLNDIIHEHNINLINNIIDVDINTFKNNIEEFILYSKQKINKLQLLDNIYSKIREKLLLNYELMEKKMENNIIEYNILDEYEKKLDYIIFAQNKVINDLEEINKELKDNLNQNNIDIKGNVFNDEELNNNINEASQNIEELDKLIEGKYLNYDLNLENINIPDKFSKTDNFFKVLENIYEPIKEINKAYRRIMLECSNLQNK